MSALSSIVSRRLSSGKPSFKLAIVLAALLALGSFGVALAATFISNQTGPAPQPQNPGWQFTVLANTVPGETVCVEVHPVGDAGNYVRQECTFQSYDGGSGTSTFTCDVFTGGVPAAFTSTTVEYQFFIADFGTSCNTDTYGFTGFGEGGTGFGNTSGNPNFTTDADGDPAPLAVQLAGFNAAAGNGQIRVTWETVSEQGNQGFNLLRGTSDAAPDRQLNDALIPSEAPNSSEGYSYEWIDADVQGGTTYYYWLEAVDANGTRARTGPVSAAYEAPTAVVLGELAASGSSVLPWLVGAAGLAVAIVGLRLRRRG
jgi:hypothetical protein